MTAIKFFSTLGLFITDLHAQPMDTNLALDSRQQSIVTISAFTAKGDLMKLRKTLNDGLNAGLTVTPKIGEVVYLNDNYQVFSQWWRAIR